MGDEWRNIDAINLMASHGALNLPGCSKVSGSDVEAIANAMGTGQEEPEYESMDGDYDIPEENRTALSQHQHRGLPPAQMIDANSDADRMMKQYMSQNGGIVVPDGQSYLDFMQSREQGGEKKVIVGELDRNKGKIIID
jgi:hypothetical protein